MTLQHLATVPSFDDPTRPADVDVSLATSFAELGGIPSATLELNPGSLDEPRTVELTEQAARALRDALDALLGEVRATVPFTDADNATPAPSDAELAVLGDVAGTCPDCGGGGEVNVCPPRCDGSHVMDTDRPCPRCAGTGDWRPEVDVDRS